MGMGSTAKENRLGPLADAPANPWVHLRRRPPYIFFSDFTNFEVLPVPYLGVPAKAKLVLLQLNPGFSEDDPKLMNDRYYVQQNRLSWTFEARVPFWALDPRLKHTPGYRYWKSKLRWLEDELGEEFLRKNLLCVEYFPYHSKSFSGPTKLVPSQEFALRLARDAMHRQLPIVVMRAKKIWTEAIPELTNYSRLFSTKGRGRQVAISPKNMPEGEFDELVRQVRAATKPRPRKRSA